MIKLAVVKPDYRITGGFEIVSEKIIAGLKKTGFEIDLIKVDMIDMQRRISSITIDDDEYLMNREFFNYTIAIDKFLKLDLSKYDMVLSTQPPSFAINHNKNALLFYHHLRIYYDLYDIYLKCKLCDHEIHSKSMQIIREIDKKFITNDKLYLAGSDNIANRLLKYNGISNFKIIRAAIDEDFYNYNGNVNYNLPIYVGRHEFPKRPELFLHALEHVNVGGKIIGEGGKTNSLKKVAKYIHQQHLNGNEIDDYNLWTNIALNIDDYFIETDESKYKENVTFTGQINKSKLVDEYKNCLCVVCTSFDEDYGLTPMEAMAFKKPVIVCKDGGGYIESVIDGVTGFIVEPTAEAISEKINMLSNNKDLAIQMGLNGYEESRKYTWNNTTKDMDLYLKEFYNN